jgi:hypothetical protein
VYAINRRASHAELNAFHSTDSAVGYVKSIGRRVGTAPSECGKKLLNGQWQFKWYPRPEQVPAEFKDGDMDATCDEVCSESCTLKGKSAIKSCALVRSASMADGSSSYFRNGICRW